MLTGWYDNHAKKGLDSWACEEMNGTNRSRFLVQNHVLHLNLGKSETFGAKPALEPGREWLVRRQCGGI